MFHPLDHPLERGWVGRLEGDRVIHLAAQTLQSFFTGGGTAREHAEYPLAEVAPRARAPPARDPRLRRPDGVRVRQSRGRRRPGRRDPRTEGRRARPASRGRHRADGRSQASRSLRTGAIPPRRRRTATSRSASGRSSSRPTSSSASRRRRPRTGARRSSAPEKCATRRPLRLGGRRALAAEGPGSCSRAISSPVPPRRCRPSPPGSEVEVEFEGDRRPPPVGRSARLRVRLVLDWDGTVTEIDGLDLALREFGDEGVYAKHEALLGRGLTLHEVIAGEFRPSGRRSTR